VKVPAEEPEPLINLSQVSEIELLIVKMMGQVTTGEHRSRSKGSGFDYVGLRDWQPGDRASSIDWPQSTLRNFSPFVVREYAQPSTATVAAVADTSLSTRCGIDGVSIAAAVARAIATIGMSAVFFQDMFGLITFDAGFRRVQALRPHVGKGQVIHCLDAYQTGAGLQEVKHAGAISQTIAGFLRRTSLVPVISDFLFDGIDDVIHELVLLNSIHDVFLVVIDSGFAFHVPDVHAEWISVVDVESGQSRIASRDTIADLANRTASWQDEVERKAREADLDVLRFGVDEARSTLSLVRFTAERRLRKAS